jgi:hypothetical protein
MSPNLVENGFSCNVAVMLRNSAGFTTFVALTLKRVMGR